jgi:histidine triad (HIT) family protein
MLHSILSCQYFACTLPDEGLLGRLTSSAPDFSRHHVTTVFKKIIDGELPAKIVYDDDRCLAFQDVNPQAPTHVLVIPRQEIASLAEASEADRDLLGHLLLVAHKVAAQQGLDHGYRVVINVGDDGGQTVPHLHIHVLGGRRLTWPPG